MSQEKKRHFGSRISSIFSSNDHHHHLNASGSNLTRKSASISKVAIPGTQSTDFMPSPNLSEKISVRSIDLFVSTPSNRRKQTNLANAEGDTRLEVPTLKARVDTQTHNGHFHSLDTKSPRKSLLENPSESTSRKKLTRKPPARDLSLESQLLFDRNLPNPNTNVLVDVIGSIDKEIHELSLEHTSHLDSTGLKSSPCPPPACDHHPELTQIPRYESILTYPTNEGFANSSLELKEMKNPNKENSYSSKLDISPPDLQKRLDENDAQSFGRAINHSENDGFTSGQHYESFVQTNCKQEGYSESSSAENLDFSVCSPAQSSINGTLLNSSSLPTRESLASISNHYISSAEQGSNIESEESVASNAENAQNDRILSTNEKISVDSTNQNDFSEYIPDNSGCKRDWEVHSNTPYMGVPCPTRDAAKNVCGRDTFEPNSSSVIDPVIINSWDRINNQEHTKDSYDAINQASKINLNLQSKVDDMVVSTQETVEAKHIGTHTRILSMSSIYSSGSNKHINLATLKRALSFRPGEGESSSYVEAIRKSAGTSFNEAGPGKWKLPIGIMPIDKRDILQQSSQKFTRGVSSLGYRAKKSSGVELKHGHLQPRLLAAEVDEGDSTNKFGALGRSNTIQNKALTPVTSKSSVPSVPLTSLERANTLASVSSAGDLRSSLTSRRGSSSSLGESLGSINDEGNVNIYYQHRGFRQDDEFQLYDGELSKRDTGGSIEESDDSEEDKPRLFLANPDAL